jgi:hypothetical protein
VKDSRPDAYQKLVDRLLASPAYGENMANYWLNVARWADTDGFLNDGHDRFLWPWRDWVIDAFNKNMPFDRFGTWQIAGDLLPKATREQQLATAFLRVGPRTNENGAIDEYTRRIFGGSGEHGRRRVSRHDRGLRACHDLKPM